MVTNPQKGDKVWVCIDSQIYEVELKDGSIDGFWERAGKFSIGHRLYRTMDHVIFPSLDALLSDLRERAVPLEGGTK